MTSRTAGEKCHVYDVVIAGGGASGLAAALELRMRDPHIDVAVIEKNSEPGRKIRATGSGRCNISNTSADGYNEIMSFFYRLGLVTRALDNGLVYPYSESAADVAELLIRRARELGVVIYTDEELIGVEAVHASHFPASKGRDAEFRIRTLRKGSRSASDMIARNVILALGGKAGPAYGTTGDGYRIARELGHSIVTPVPVLTATECAEWDKASRPCGLSLAGTRTRGIVRLEKTPARGKEPELVFEELGEIQFTRYGLSGICVFNMTRHMRYDRAAGESLANYVILADLFPDGDIREYLSDRRQNAPAGEKSDGVLRTVLKENIAAYVLASAGSGFGDKDVRSLTDGDISAIGKAVHSLAFHPSGIRGWKEAQATSGGVSTAEISDETSESLLVPGLYITGELADRDFPCGGFNLSNAWLTGIHAADHILQSDHLHADTL